MLFLTVLVVAKRVLEFIVLDGTQQREVHFRKHELDRDIHASVAIQAANRHGNFG